MTREKMLELARSNVEKHIGDVAAEYDPEEMAAVFREEVYVLAFDAVYDAGAGLRDARLIAEEVAESYSS